ncbi:MAG: tetratricopeptide repeat protein [Longimicrobiales bacterium]
MPKPDLWTRLREARIVQVLLVYLGACWGILQLVDVLQGALALPAWVSPVSLILLLIGLVIILATAWVQSLPSTVERERAGAVPQDWEVAPGEILSSLASGDFPHLTWGRSILGGILALSLMFGLAGVVTLFRGPLTSLGTAVGPAEAGASPAADGIAILPFDVAGPESELWREGMVDLLSSGLDGIGGYRTIDARTVLARWDRMTPAGEKVELEEALKVAGATDARFAVVGSAVSLGGKVRLSGEIYDLGNGEKVGQGQVEGSPDKLLDLVDQLAVEVTRALLTGKGGVEAMENRIESLTTNSLPALRAYLEGAAFYRRADFPRAADAFLEAIRYDSTFALAYFRLDASYGSMEVYGTEEARMAAEGLARYGERLPTRAQRIVEAGKILAEGDISRIPYLVETTQRFPDDPEGWFWLGEMYFHHGGPALVSLEETLAAWERALELDPGFAPTYIHLIQCYVAAGDSARARQYLDEYRQLAPEESHQVVALSLAYDLVFGNAGEREEARRRVAAVSDHVAGDTWVGLGPGPSSDGARETLARERVQAGQVGFLGDWIWAQASQGRVSDAFNTLETARDLPASDRAVLLYGLSSLTGITPSQETLDPDAVLKPGSCEAARSTDCLLVVGAHAADRRRWKEVDLILEAMAGRAAPSSPSEGDPPIQAAAWEASRVALDAYRVWRSGQPRQAFELLESVQGKSMEFLGLREPLVRIWLGELALELGRQGSAVRFLESVRRSEFRWYGDFRLVEAYAAAGQPDEAQRIGAEFLASWSGADPGLPQLEGARESLAAIPQ